MPHRQLGSVPPPVPPPPAPESYNPSAYRGLVSFFCTSILCAASFVPVWSEIWWNLVLILLLTHPFLPAFTGCLFYCFTKKFSSFIESLIKFVRSRIVFLWLKLLVDCMVNFVAVAWMIADWYSAFVSIKCWLTVNETEMWWKQWHKAIWHLWLRARGLSL